MDDYVGDLFGGRKDRDEGMKRVALKSGDWFREAMLIVIATFKPGWTGLAEEFQSPVKAKIGPPYVPQVWSSMTNQLIRKGWFEHTGEHDQCRKRTSHACDGKYLTRIGKGYAYAIPDEKTGSGNADSGGGEVEPRHTAVGG